LTIVRIQESVAEYFKLAPTDLTGTSRVANVVWPGSWPFTCHVS